VAVAEDAQDRRDDNEPTTPVPQRTFKYKGEKVWKPKRTAQLGVSSLGRPAEVLLLSERERPIPKAPAEPEKLREGDVLPLAWNTENLSLSSEQVTKNIEQIRDQASKDLEGDQGVQRTQVRKKLQMGFSASQLQNYIEQKQGDAAKPWRKRPYSKGFHYSVKAQMAWYIFKHIWGIQGQEATETAETVEADTSKEIQMPPDMLEALLSTDNATLRQISVGHNVQIDFFRPSIRKPAQIIISGTSKAVEAAREALQKLRGNVRKQSIEVGDRQKIEYGVDEASLLAEIRQRYGVHVKSMKSGIHVYYHVDKPPDAAAIRRHLLLAQRQPPQESHSTIWPDTKSESLVKIHLGLSADMSHEAMGRSMRLIAPEGQVRSPSVVQMSKDQKSSFSKVYNSTREAVTLNQKQKKLVAAQPGTRNEIRAFFGQALINDGDSGQISAISPNMKLSFTTQIPLLAQFLVKRKLWKATETQPLPSAGSVDNPDQCSANNTRLLYVPEFIYQLVLSPGRSPPSHLPRLKIQLGGANVTLGLNQQLQVKNISAMLAEKTSYLLLPTQAVDVRFERQLVREIYRESVQSDARHQVLLSQLAKYFNTAGALPKPKFASFVSLSIPNDLRTNAHSKNNNQNVDLGHEYILESAEALDIASYRPPFNSKLCLEHVVFMEDDRGDGRQMLQLAEQSMISAPSQHKTTFASFFNSAYEIARWLGDPGLLRKSQKD
jgi:Mitochondrial inner-membrane-bound regulator